MNVRVLGKEVRGGRRTIGDPCGPNGPCDSMHRSFSLDSPLQHGPRRLAMLRFLRMGNKRTKMVWWVLIVVTVVTFLGGFVFLFGAGFDSTRSARISGAIGTVNGTSISREEYQS